MRHDLVEVGAVLVSAVFRFEQQNHFGRQNRQAGLCGPNHVISRAWRVAVAPIDPTLIVCVATKDVELKFG